MRKKRVLSGAALLTVGAVLVFVDFGERGTRFDLLLGLAIGVCAALGAALLATSFGRGRDSEDRP